MLPERATDNGHRALARPKRLSRKAKIHQQELEGGPCTQCVKCAVSKSPIQPAPVAIGECWGILANQG